MNRRGFFGLLGRAGLLCGLGGLAGLLVGRGQVRPLGRACADKGMCGDCALRAGCDAGRGWATAHPTEAKGRGIGADPAENPKRRGRGGIEIPISIVPGGPVPALSGSKRAER